MQIQALLPLDRKIDSIVVVLPAANYEKALTDLLDIIDNVGEQFYSLWKDPLSFDLLKWASTVTLIEMDVELDIVEQFKNNLEKYINELATKILIDAIQKTSLNDPVLVMETLWTCEKELIEKSDIKLNGQGLTLQIHEFALKMLDWFHSLYPKEPLLANFYSNAQIVTQDQSFYNTQQMESIKRSFYTSYRMKAKTKHMQEQVQASAEAVRKDTEQTAKLVEIIEERLQERIKTEKQAVQVSADALNERCDKMEKNFKKEINILTDQADAQDQKLIEIEKQAYELKLANFRLEQEQGTLKQQIIYRQWELACLRQRMEDSDNNSWCVIQ